MTLKVYQGIKFVVAEESPGKFRITKGGVKIAEFTCDEKDNGMLLLEASLAVDRFTVEERSAFRVYVSHKKKEAIEGEKV